MKIQKVYEKYKIMPQLQLHMLRVAGVANLICDNFSKEVKKDLIIRSCLLHDLGNMAKIKLDRFPEFAQPQGKKYWNKILANFKHKYGSDDYAATYKILEELDVSGNIYNLTRSLEFAKSPQTAKRKGFEIKICLYCDARVSPNSVVPLKQRLNEVKNRYIENRKVSLKKFEQISKSLYSIEKQISKYCKIKPNEITEAKVKKLFPELLEYEI